ncbi:hypothetical protein V6N12_069783 [Hibiscus sabdariffa]|uniref:Aminotransferase-like plant mobile domain-containing protein n=1 Tax=Hibiscus sabdariffa TaxID=183260 RepID=A0ABR2FEY6_9ROSI
MGKLNMYDFSQNLAPRKFHPHSDVVTTLANTGFEHIIKPTNVSRHCRPLVVAVLKRYNKRNRCFEFGADDSIRLYITLGDVLRITGLPINDRLVIVNESKINPNHLCSTYLGKEDILQRKVPSSPSVVPSFYLHFLRDVGKIGKYASGATMLAYLYYNLDEMNEEKLSIYGNLHFLSMFIFERIPWVVSQCLCAKSSLPYDFMEPEDNHDHRPREFPLMVGWHELMTRASRNSMGVLIDLTFINYFKQLSQDNVQFNPYACLEEDFFPQNYRRQVDLERCLTSIICANVRILYDPGVLITRRPREDIPCTIPAQEEEDVKDDMEDDVDYDEHQDQTDDIPRNLLPEEPNDAYDADHQLGDGEQPQGQRELLVYRRRLAVRQIEGIPLQLEEQENEGMMRSRIINLGMMSSRIISLGMIEGIPLQLEEPGPSNEPMDPTTLQQAKLSPQIDLMKLKQRLHRFGLTPSNQIPTGIKRRKKFPNRYGQ